MKQIANRQQKQGNCKFEICNLKFAICHLSIILSIVAMATTAFAQHPQPPQIVGIRVGLANRYKVGLWTQVEVTLHGGGEAMTGELSIVVPDGDGVPSRVSTSPEQPCKLLPGRDTVVRLLCRFGRVRSSAAVEFRAGGRVVAERIFEPATTADAEHFLPGLEFQKLIVTLGPSAVDASQIGQIAGIESEFRPVEAQLTTIEQLPTDWRAYEGVDAVIFSTSRPEIYRKQNADCPPLRALDEWTRLGGRVILCAGDNAEQLLGDKGTLQFLSPGRFVKMVSLRQFGAFESYSGSRLSIPQNGDSKAIRVPRLADVQGTIEAREADLPLIVRTPRGFGQILFVAADLDGPPLRQWPDRPLLLAQLLDMPSSHAEDPSESGAMMHYGYSDLSGQLRSALDRFPGVRLTPFWLVAGLIAVYLLLIGPIDYFFLRKFVGRMTWTWLTFPLVVLLVCGGAYAMAFRLKGDRAKVHQATLVDVDAASGRLRGVAWLNIFSPRTETFNLSILPHPAKVGDCPNFRAAKMGLSPSGTTWIAWLGLPGTALGGMNPQAGTPALWTEPYDFSPRLDALRDVPIQVWSTKSFTAQWHGNCPVLAEGAFPKADLTECNQLLEGAVTNAFDFPLEQCLLAYGRSVYDLGTLAPGESARLGPMTKRSELKTLLTGRKVVFTEGGEKYRQEATPYDPASADIPYILRMMTFYEIAGGRRYTGLWNAYQGHVELSSLLKANRAILLAQTSNDATKNAGNAVLLRDNQPLDAKQTQNTTMYRFLFPIKRGERKEERGE
jgi:hypothetical protein